MIRMVASLAAIVVAGPLVGLAMVMFSLGAVVEAQSNPLNPEPSQFALDDIPPLLLDHYRLAALTCPGLPWTVVAGIGKVETNHARFGGAVLAPDGEVSPPILGPVLDGSLPGTRPIPLSGPSPWHLHPRFDRALGPMQFLTDTFRRHGVDGNGDGEANPHNAIDAIHSAVAYLCGDRGEVTNLTDAIFTYNRSQTYVNQVLELAARYGVAPLFAGSDPGQLIDHPNVTMGPAQRADLEAGLIDPQLVAILLSVAHHHRITISSLVTGHSLCVARTGTYPNCTMSRHASGRGADISMVDGQPVTDHNQAARDLVVLWHSMDRSENFLRPWTIGHPYGALAGQARGSFNDGDHEDHLHLGVTGTVAAA